MKIRKKAFFATKFISRPIKNVSAITKEIAKGNFDVEINYKSHDELGIIAENFNLMAKELKNMEYLRKDFMSSVSHEFKTPIAPIKIKLGIVNYNGDEELVQQIWVNLIGNAIKFSND